VLVFGQGTSQHPVAAGFSLRLLLPPRRRQSQAKACGYKNIRPSGRYNWHSSSREGNEVACSCVLLGKAAQENALNNPSAQDESIFPPLIRNNFSRLRGSLDWILR